MKSGEDQCPSPPTALPVDEEQRAGRHQVKFDSADLASGIYLYRLKAGNFVQSRKMLVIK